MARRRPLPSEEGCAERFMELLLAPLKAHKPDDMETKDWLEILFCVKERDITKYKVRRGFNLSGLFLATPNVVLQGVGHKHVNEGSIVYVRTDATQPNVIHFEYNTTHGEQVFLLTQSEWTLITPYLEEITWTEKPTRKVVV